MSGSTDQEACLALFLRFCVPVTLGERHGRATITLQVPDEAAGRVTPQHPGASIAFNFINGGFVGLVRMAEEETPKGKRGKVNDG